MRQLALGLGMAAVVALVGSGCGPDDHDPTPFPTATPSRTATAGGSTATPTATRTLTVTPTPFPAHVEVVVASDEDGGGKLVSHFEFEGSIPLYFSQCFGGTGPECEGGMALYTAGSPGVEALEESEPDESLYVLDDETPITIEVTEIAAGLSLTFETERLDAPGESALIGTTPEIHADLETQLLAPGGDLSEVAVKLVLKTSAEPPYSASEPFTITFVPVIAGEHEHEHED